MARVVVTLVMTVMVTRAWSGVSLQGIVHPEARYARDIQPIQSSPSDGEQKQLGKGKRLNHYPFFSDYHQHKVRNWLQSYQDLLGTIMPGSVTEQTPHLSITTPAPEPTTTTSSLLMSLIGDFIPYITGDASDESDDHGDDISDDNFVRRQGLAYQPGDGGGESKR